MFVHLILEIPNNHPLFLQSNLNIDELITLNGLFLKNEFELKEWVETQNNLFDHEMFVHDFNSQFFKTLSDIESSRKVFRVLKLHNGLTLKDILAKNVYIQSIDGFVTDGYVFEEHTLEDGSDIPVIVFENMETKNRKEVDLVFSLQAIMSHFNPKDSTFIFTELGSGVNKELTIGYFQKIGLVDVEDTRPFKFE